MEQELKNKENKNALRFKSVDNDVKPEDQGLPGKDERSFVLVSNPVFRRLFWLIRWIGTVILLANIVTDLLYVLKQEFTSQTYYFSYIGVCAFRLLVPIILCIVYMKKNVCGKKPVAFTFDIDQEKRQKLQKDYLCAGVLLYFAVPITFISGCFRLLPVRNFAREVGIGFILDLLFLLPLFFLQGLNNATL